MNNLDNLTPSFSESIDITITTKCDGGCKHCYLNCKEKGIHADLNQPMFDTLHTGTELALNGNDLSHPDLENFLIRMKDKGIFCNITVNQIHLDRNMSKLLEWQNRRLVCGVGISLSDSSDKTLLSNMAKLKNTVLHVIDGLFSKSDIENLMNHNISIYLRRNKMKLSIRSILNLTSSDYQFRFNNMWDVYTYTTRHSDEMHLADFKVVDNNLPERSKFENLIMNNSHVFTKTHNEIIVKSDLNNLINLDILELRAEDDQLIIVVSYGSNNLVACPNTVAKWHL